MFNTWIYMTKAQPATLELKGKSIIIQLKDEHLVLSTEQIERNSLTILAKC